MPVERVRLCVGWILSYAGCTRVARSKLGVARVSADDVAFLLRAARGRWEAPLKRSLERVAGLIAPGPPPTAVAALYTQRAPTALSDARAHARRRMQLGVAQRRQTPLFTMESMAGAWMVGVGARVGAWPMVPSFDASACMSLRRHARRPVSCTDFRSLSPQPATTCPSCMP